VTTMARGKPINMPCLDKLAQFLFYAIVIDLSLEILDFIHRLYESEESIEILSQLIEGRLFMSLIVLQLLLGTLVPFVVLGLTTHAFRPRPLVQVPAELRRMLYLVAAVLVQIGIFSMRFNVVIGGQLFSKSLRGLTVYKVEFLGIEGLASTIFFMILPLFILWALVKILPPWLDEPGEAAPTEA
jgi:hypothetical protein